MIESGRVKVNGKQVKVDYKFKDNDFLESTVHRSVLLSLNMSNCLPWCDGKKVLLINMFLKNMFKNKFVNGFIRSEI